MGYLIVCRVGNSRFRFANGFILAFMLVWPRLSFASICEGKLAAYSQDLRLVLRRYVPPRSSPKRRAKYRYRSLPAAQKPSDGKNLRTSTTMRTLTKDFPVYSEKMGNAVNLATRKLKGAIQERRVTPDLISSIRDQLAAARKEAELEIAKTLSDPKRLKGVEEFGKKNAGAPVDYIPSEYESRFWKILGNREYRQGGSITIVVNKKVRSIPLAGINRFDHTPKIQHDRFSNSRRYSDLADQLLAEELNKPEISESRVVEKVASAFTIYINHPPYERGTSSVAMALDDVIVRAALGKSFPPPRPGTEPALDVMLPIDGIDRTIETFLDLFAMPGGAN